ncbi:MAG: hypothetical protein ACI4ML_06800 [Aristaeellaceae bacterium]
MKWYTKLLIFVGVATLVMVIAGMVYVVNAKYQMNEYALQTGLAFNAATLVNASETHTEEEQAVVAEYQGRRAIIVPENYKTVLSYLRRSYAMPPFAHVSKDTALHLTICGASECWVAGDRDGQGATVLFTSAGKSFTMHVSGSDLWQKLLSACLDGTYNAENLPL